MAVVAIEMGISTHERTLVDFLAVLRGKSSVFCYKDNLQAPELVTIITQEIENEEKIPVIRICWNENELDNKDFSDNATSFYIFKNFTTALIKIEKMLTQGKHLILVSDISNLEKEQNSRPYIRFLSILLRKSEEYDSTMIAMVGEKCSNPLVKAELIPHFKKVFLLTESKTIKSIDGSPEMRYSIENGKLYLETQLQDDMNKIKEIFSLTPEEKKELDRIVGESLEEYRTSL
ncbi:MAG: hypothetical protein PWQ51_439 [Methanolobus sp.]|jgi:hypothetical protein|uniref:RecA-superfamily ATPase possibly involved in signal transduction n=1 Tax=Methanolobus tindarius DSM 2278 TaxID=1090322 RepID=W9DNV6_METTI|nr:hypothetical protein [Methanolobus tindarius]ETA66713.1 hypothetical protein MettiDRAFT_0113 [Methanolobus tindarius DSM 2278]MDK2938275.1 hypothetical protein [Methanolobus sp.]